MSFVKCIDAVTAVTDEATKKFADKVKESSESKRTLKILCNNIDTMLNKVGGTALEASVDEKTLGITVSIVCESLEISNPANWEFGILVPYLNEINFSHRDDDHIRIDFKMSGIWEVDNEQGEEIVTE